MVQQKILKKLGSIQKIVLYAPTWKDCENSSSFEGAISHLVENLPESWGLIVKLHPHLLSNQEEKNRALLHKYEMHERVLFLEDFPPVYPLLQVADIYVGDLSSIGYDFLGFNKPMFFLNSQNREAKTDLGLYLYQCGIEIRPDQYPFLYDIIKENLKEDASRFKSIREKINDYTFAPTTSETALKKEILSSYNCLPDKDLNFF